jgi:hypothetical protein
VTAFFMPGNGDPGSDAEAYERLCQEATADTGHPPRSLRIFRLAFRHEGADLEVEVGGTDPLSGGTVAAILDLGRESPYLIECVPQDGAAVRSLVRKPVYSVTEFTA